MISLTDAEIAVLQARLTKAEIAYDNIMVGGGITQVRDQNGEQITYSPANSSRLAAYIADLKSQLGISTSRSPMRTVGGFSGRRIL